MKAVDKDNLHKLSPLSHILVFVTEIVCMIVSMQCSGSSRDSTKQNYRTPNKSNLSQNSFSATLGCDDFSSGGVNCKTSLAEGNGLPLSLLMIHLQKEAQKAHTIIQ